MKKLLSALLIASMLMLCASALAEAYVYITGSANVRTGPSLGYTSVGQLEKGSTVDYLQNYAYDSRGVRWYKISFADGSGWVCALNAALTDTPDSAIYASGGQGGSTNAGFFFSGTEACGEVYAESKTNLRSGPSLSHSLLGTMKKDTAAEYLGSTSYDSRGVAWYNVRYEGKTGWVSSGYTTLTLTVSSFGAVEGSTGQSNVRTGPGLGHSSIGTLYKGESAEFLGKTSVDERGVTWYNIRFNDQDAWVSEKYTKLVQPETTIPESEINFGVVKGHSGKSNVRTGPGLDYKSLGTLDKGESADFLGNTAHDERGVKWYNIRYEGQNAWVSEKYTIVE